MGKPRINDNIIEKLRTLRLAGKSIKEIVKELNLGTGTVSKYCKGLTLNKEAKIILEAKKYPAKRISLEEKVRAEFHAKKIIKDIDPRDIFLIFTALYWGEGTKSELNIINGDPNLVLFFVKGLLSLGIEKERIKISIRYYSTQNKNELTSFWLCLLALDKSNVVGFERVESTSHTNKLMHGMCRVRVKKSSYYHKLVTSAIKILSSPRSSMDRTEAS
jgi:transcriptional regulator with XRE-family HTH domain